MRGKRPPIFELQINNEEPVKYVKAYEWEKLYKKYSYKKRSATQAWTKYKQIKANRNDWKDLAKQLRKDITKEQREGELLQKEKRDLQRTVKWKQSLQFKAEEKLITANEELKQANTIRRILIACIILLTISNVIWILI